MPAASRVLEVRTAGATVCVPASLACVTTYILLEQEGWFEKEAGFIGRVVEAGDTAVDIGANHGVYSLALAAAVGPGGRVIAYEPDAQAAALLNQSKAANGFAHLSLEQRAMSNVEGEGALFKSPLGSEYNSLQRQDGHGGSVETVSLTTLAAEAARLGWDRLDFLKIDAEGEETRILEGGREVLTRHSPLIMFEVDDARQQDLGAAQLLKTLGYDLYRLLGPGSILAPARLENLTPWQLNLFAARPDRARRLEERGLLARAPRSPGDFAPGAADWVFAQPHLAAFGIGPGEIAEPYRRGLAAFGVWRDPGRAPSERYGALIIALNGLKDAVNQRPSAGRLASLARAAFEADEWRVMQSCLASLRAANAVPAGEPFLPISPRFDTLWPGAAIADWFFLSLAEQIEITRGYSSYFDKSNLKDLAQMSTGELASPEIQRRLALQLTLAGKAIPQGLALALMGDGHRNRQWFSPEALAALAAN